MDLVTTASVEVPLAAAPSPVEEAILAAMPELEDVGGVEDAGRKRGKRQRK